MKQQQLHLSSWNLKIFLYVSYLQSEQVLAVSLTQEDSFRLLVPNTAVQKANIFHEIQCKKNNVRTVK